MKINIFDIIQNADTGIEPGTLLTTHMYTLEEVEIIVKEAIGIEQDRAFRAFESMFPDKDEDK